METALFPFDVLIFVNFLSLNNHFTKSTLTYLMTKQFNLYSTFRFKNSSYLYTKNYGICLFTFSRLANCHAASSSQFVLFWLQQESLPVRFLMNLERYRLMLLYLVESFHDLLDYALRLATLWPTQVELISVSVAWHRNISAPCCTRC